MNHDQKENHTHGAQRPAGEPTLDKDLMTAISSMLRIVDGTHRVDPAVMGGYLRALADLDRAAVLEAIEELVKVSESHIPPARIRRQVLGTSSTAAEDAFAFYFARMRQVGAMAVRATDHPDPKAQAAMIAVGGADKLNCHENDLPVLRSRFIDAYNNPSKKTAAKGVRGWRDEG